MISFEDLQSTISFQQNRSFIMSWSEVHTNTGLTPSEATCANTKSTLVDPLFYLTQSQKNYKNGEFLIQNYTKTDLFTNYNFEYGVSKKVDYIKTKPIHYHLQDANNWYFKQSQLLKLSFLFSLTPGFEEVRLISSVALNISDKKSDIDIIIKTKKGHVLSTRIWTKLLILKILRLDVHSTRLETSLTLVKTLKYVFKTNFIDKLEKEIITKIENFKNRGGLKIDLGACFDDFEVLKNHFGENERQYLWLYNSKKIIFNPNEVLQNNDACGFLYLKTTSLQKSLLTLILKPMICFLYWIIYPFSYFQIPFYNFKNKNNTNFIYNTRIISFIPVIYKSDHFFKKIT